MTFTDSIPTALQNARTARDSGISYDRTATDRAMSAPIGRMI